MNIRAKYIWGALLLLLIAVATWYFVGRKQDKKTPPKVEVKLEKVTVNEAVRTLLYLPLYHAKQAGYFEKHGIDVNIVTGGTATNSFAAMTSGEAQFSQADPMYVPIANEKGGNTQVIAQVVSKIAVWGIAMDSTIKTMDKKTLRGKTLSTQTKPMTAFVYSEKLINDLGLKPDKDVKILQNKPGTEILPLLNKQSQFAMTLEPNVSTAISQGAHVVYSFPKVLGEQIFTGLMAKEDYINSHEQTVIKVLIAYQEAINDIYAHPDSALKTAKIFFPQLKEEVLKMALQRLLDEEVIPKSILMTNESWDKAINVRVKAGDLKVYTSRDKNCRIGLINKAINKK